MEWTCEVQEVYPSAADVLVDTIDDPLCWIDQTAEGELIILRIRRDTEQR